MAVATYLVKNRQLPPTKARAVAQTLLGRYVPLDCADAQEAIDGAREILAADLDGGNLQIAKWVVAHYASAIGNNYEGIADQLRPLINHLQACVVLDAELAAEVQPLARDLGLDDLRQQCLTTVRNGFAKNLRKGR